MQAGLLPLCLVLGFLLGCVPVSAQSANDLATLVIVDSRDAYLWDYRVRFFDENGKEVATMKRCEIVRLSMTPGLHKFQSNKDKKKIISINAVAGETYYARAGIGSSLPRFMWFEFELVTRTQAESWTNKCKLPASSLDAETAKSEQQP